MSHLFTNVTKLGEYGNLCAPAFLDQILQLGRTLTISVQWVHEKGWHQAMFTTLEWCVTRLPSSDDPVPNHSKDVNVTFEWITSQVFAFDIFPSLSLCSLWKQSIWQKPMKDIDIYNTATTKKKLKADAVKLQMPRTKPSIYVQFGGV